MANINPKNFTRNVVVSEESGNNVNDGLTTQLPKKEWLDDADGDGALTLANSLAPSVADPVSIVEFGAGRYSYASVLSVPDYCRVNVQDSSITCSGILLPDSSFFRAASIISTGAGSETLIDTNGKSRTSIIAFGLVTSGDGDVAHEISGASSECFADVGQIFGYGDNQTGSLYTAVGDTGLLSYNKISIGISGALNPDNYTAIKIDTPETRVISYRVPSIVNNGTGTGHIGVDVVSGNAALVINEISLAGDTALRVNGTSELSADFTKVSGDMLFNSGNSSVSSERYEGNITHLLGEIDLDILHGVGDFTGVDGLSNLRLNRWEGDIDQQGGTSSISAIALDGNVDVSGGLCNLFVQDLTGNLDFTSLQVLSCNIIKLTGDLTLNGLGSSVSVQYHIGDFFAQAGINVITAPALVGSLDVSGGASEVNINIISANLTIGAGVLFEGLVSTVLGTVTIDATATVNARIDGIEYGSWVAESGDTYVTTFLRDGTIPPSWETVGALTIDTTTDTIEEVLGSYSQTTGLTRTVDFRLIDADTLDIYYTGSNTSAGASARYYAPMTATATALPANQVVNLLFQNERTGGGGGINGGGGQIEIERTS